MEFLVEYLPLFMFVVLAIFLFSGFPVAFVLGGVGLGFWLLAVWLGVVNDKSFYLVVSRIFGGVVQNLILVAIPMFIFMGTMLEKSGVARDLLHCLQVLTRRVPGGLALSVVVLGVIMAATTGIIGASVVMMTLLALPIMAERGYHLPLATGTIASSGTLGILIPPSIMLVVMGDLLSVSIGTLFFAALIPGLLLALLYFAYIVWRAVTRPDYAPPLVIDRKHLTAAAIARLVVRSFLPPFALIMVVLGSILGGFATPTEASGIGAVGATLLAALKGKLSFAVLKDVTERTALIGAMLFGIFVGATAFSFVFTLLGGNDLIVGAVSGIAAGPWGVLIALMVVVFLLGFFFDWVQVSLIILPVFAPIIRALDFGDHIPYADMSVIWFAILVAINLQTSFLTPPFGFALFYMKGAAPPEVKIQHIYRGIVPFVLLQLAGLVAVMIWPEIALWLPAKFGL